MRRSSRIGFTLVELLVVIAIIGVLVGLLLPAVQMAREAMRKAQCLSNMRQVAIGIQSFENSKRRYPGYLEIYGNGTSNVGKIGSWVVPILPYLEQNPAYELWASSSENANWISAGSDPEQFARFYPNVPQLICASNQITVTKQKVARNSFVCNAGFLPEVGKPLPPQYTSNSSENSVRSQRIQNGVFTNQLPTVANTVTVFGRNTSAPVKVRADSIKDGLSSTMALSENFQAVEWSYYRLNDDSTRFSLGMVWLYRDGPNGKVTAGRNAPAPVQPVNLINGPKGQLIQAPVNNLESGRPSSGHTGVVNVGFLDGSARAISDEIEYATYQNLMTPQTKGSDMPNTFHVLPADVSE